MVKNSFPYNPDHKPSGIDNSNVSNGKFMYNFATVCLLCLSQFPHPEKSMTQMHEIVAWCYANIIAITPDLDTPTLSHV